MDQKIVLVIAEEKWGGKATWIDAGFGAATRTLKADTCAPTSAPRGTGLHPCVVHQPDTSPFSCPTGLHGHGPDGSRVLPVRRDVRLPPPASADAEPSAVPGRSRTPPRGRTSLCKPTQGGDSRGSPWFLPSRLPAVHGTGETSRVAAKLAHATPSSHPRPRPDCCSHAARQRAGGRRRVCGEFGGWADPPGSATAPIHHPSTHIVSLSPLVPSRGAEVGAHVSGSELKARCGEHV